jgi:hypothetical protein
MEYGTGPKGLWGVGKWQIRYITVEAALRVR